MSPTASTTYTNIITPTGTTLNTKNIEKAIFTNPAPTNKVTLDDGNVYSEMAVLAKEVYGPLETFADGHPEPLAYETDSALANAALVGAAAVGRGWHEVSALELGIPAADFGLLSNGLKYSFVDGFYQAEGIATPSSEANALVLSGVVNGKTTLCVDFRGTDQAADIGDYANFVNQHYAKFLPLVNALKQYAATGGFQQILIDGHSLGAAMAQIFANDLSKVVSSSNIQVFTFGSPGAEIPSNVTNQVNFVNTDDLVPEFGLLSDNYEARTALVNGFKVLARVLTPVPVVGLIANAFAGALYG